MAMIRWLTRESRTLPASPLCSRSFPSSSFIGALLSAFATQRPEAGGREAEVEPYHGVSRSIGDEQRVQRTIIMYARHLRRLGHQWRAASVLAIGAGGALLTKDSGGDGKNKRRVHDVALRSMCHCEAIAISTPPAAELQTRGERLTQQKSSSTAKAPVFDLKQTYNIIRVVGEGAYGLVYHARRKSDGRDVALKAMPREFTGQTDFEREVAAMQLLSNKANQKGEDTAPICGQDRIVELYDLHRDNKNYYLSMELIEGGELFDHLIAGGPFSEATAATFLRQFAEGISYIHNAGLCHADLKPENLVLTGTGLKLVDFGCACSHDTSKKELQLPAQEFATGCSFLHMVALGNQFELERMLMEKQSLVNFRDYDFRTPLHLAASEGHVDICRFLINKGARINRTDRWGGSPLDDAHRHKHTTVIQYLREQGAKFGKTSTEINKFIEAASAGDIEEVKALLEFGTTLDMNQGDYDQRTALHLACSEGRLKMVELLVRQDGVDVNVKDRWGNLPLDDAKRAKRNSEQIVKELKAHGAIASSFRPFASQRGKIRSNKQKDTTSTGTAFYWPPEMFIEGATPSPPIDMWAAGIIMYVVLTGSHPFDKFADKTDEEIKELVVKVGSCDEDEGHQNLLDEIVFDERVDELSDSCVELMRQLMHPDPKQRMTSEDFLRHPWIQGLTASRKTMDVAHKKHLQRRFKTSVSKRFGDGGEGVGRQLRDIFDAIDIARNGVLDANELRVVLRSAGEPEDVITKIVASMNFQKHGGKVQGVAFNEFERIMNMNEE